MTNKEHYGMLWSFLEWPDLATPCSLTARFLSHRFTGIEACLYLRRNFVFDFSAHKQFEA